MVIRELEAVDFRNGFFETLENLSSLEGLTTKRAIQILQEISINPLYRIFVVEDKGQIVGATTLLVEQKFIHNGSRVGHIEDVATRKGWEHKGIGSAVVKHTIEAARKEGCYKVVLDCSKERVTFYERLGFRRSALSMRFDT